MRLSGMQLTSKEENINDRFSQCIKDHLSWEKINRYRSLNHTFIIDVEKADLTRGGHYRRY